MMSEKVRCYTCGKEIDRKDAMMRNTHLAPPFDPFCFYCKKCAIRYFYISEETRKKIDDKEFRELWKSLK